MPVRIRFERKDAGQGGNLEGYYHQGYYAEGEDWYHNPFAPGRLSDDEIAVATCLESMRGYLETGKSFYSLAEASQDHYLSLLLDEATTTTKPIESPKQPHTNNKPKNQKKKTNHKPHKTHKQLRQKTLPLT